MTIDELVYLLASPGSRVANIGVIVNHAALVYRNVAVTTVYNFGLALTQFYGHFQINITSSSPDTYQILVKISKQQ